MNESPVAERQFAVPGGDAAELLEVAEVILDQVWIFRLAVGGMVGTMPCAASTRRTKILCQIPDLAQRVKRLWTLFQLPYPAGSSFRCATPTGLH